jgi:tetratricopeptide (TPR) repeat protein
MRKLAPIRPLLLAALLLALAAGWAGADGAAVPNPPAAERQEPPAVAQVAPPAAGAGAQAASLQWSNAPDATLAKAKAEGRPVYIYIWAKYNPNCVYMADVTLADDAVMAQLGNFELVALDADNRANFPFFDRYKIRYVRMEGPNNEPVPYENGLQVKGGAMYPTNLFLDTEGREVFRMYGQVDPKAFATRLGQVQQLLKAWDNQRANPTSATAEAQLGHLYAELQVIPEAKKHLQRALALDPNGALQPDINLDLIIMGIPDDPTGSLPKLQAWEKQYATHPRLLEAVYYEAVANAAAGAQLIDTSPEISPNIVKETVACYDAALRILDRFLEAKPGSAEFQSPWYQQANKLIAGIQKARTGLLAAPPR